MFVLRWLPPKFCCLCRNSAIFISYTILILMMEIKVRWKMLYVVAASLLLLMLQLAAAHSLSSPYHTSHEVIFSASHFSVWMERISIWFAPFVTIADIFYQSTYIFYHHDGDGSRNSFFFFFSLYFCIHVVAVVVRDVCARSRVCVCVYSETVPFDIAQRSWLCHCHSQQAKAVANHRQCTQLEAFASIHIYL